MNEAGIAIGGNPNMKDLSAKLRGEAFQAQRENSKSQLMRLVERLERQGNDQLAEAARLRAFYDALPSKFDGLAEEGLDRLMNYAHKAAEQYYLAGR